MMVDLQFAKTLFQLPPDELALELYALLEAAQFDYRKFARVLDQPDKYALPIYEVAMLGYADAWRTVGPLREGEQHRQFNERVFRWKVILA
jgi:hypothetical protein